MIRQKLLNLLNRSLGNHNYWEIRQVVNNEGKICSSSVNCYHYIKKRGKNVENNQYNRAINGMGMCLICGKIDFRTHQERHIFGKKSDKLTITLCANHHQILHWERGRHW